MIMQDFDKSQSGITPLWPARSKVNQAIFAWAPSYWIYIIFKSCSLILGEKKSVILRRQRFELTVTALPLSFLKERDPIALPDFLQLFENSLSHKCDNFSCLSPRVRNMPRRWGNFFFSNYRRQLLVVQSLNRRTRTHDILHSEGSADFSCRVGWSVYGCKGT